MKHIQLLKKNEKFNLPTGDYLVCDACYLFPDTPEREDLAFYAAANNFGSWDKPTKDINKSLCDSGIAHYDDNKTGINLPTAHGDCLVESSGKVQDVFGCDAGNISLFQVTRQEKTFTLPQGGQIELHKRGYWTVTDHMDDVVICIDTR